MFFLFLAVFVFPIAVYCTILGTINRRPRPLMVSGAWDFVGVLLATSGFLLFVGPALLTGAFQQSLHDLPMERDGPSIGSALEETLAAWWVMWALYYVIVLGGAALLVRMRSHTTIIYNVELQALEGALARSALKLGLEIERRGNRHYLGADRTAAPLVETHTRADGDPAPLAVSETNWPARFGAPSIIVDVEPMPLLANVSLHWRSAAGESRANLESELRKALSEVITLDNSAGGWLLGVAAFLFFLIMLLTGIFVAMMMALARSY